MIFQPAVSSLAAARAAYRLAWRTSAITFSGDDRVKKAYRLKVRMELLNPTASTSEEQYKQKIMLANEMSDVIRKNIVQGILAENGKFRLRFTPETELGNNDDIKKKTPNRAAVPCQPCRQPEQSPPESDPPRTKRRNYSALKRTAAQRVIPELKEEDLEERFVRGSGPGGQSVNKTENNVQLLHRPTGIRVSCHETRSLQQNRKIARRILLERLDQHFNPGLSKSQMQQAKKKERERQKKKKQRKKKRSCSGESEQSE